MSPRNRLDSTAGIVLVGTHPWTRTAFDRLPPRPLLPVAHRPVLSYSLSWLRDAGVHHAAVCANRETQILESRLHRQVPHGLRVTYHEDAMPRGAAGAARDAALTSDASVFVIADGTAIPTVDFTEILTVHHAERAALTVVSHLEPGRHGKPPVQIPTGIYVVNRAVLERVPERGFYDIKETLIPQLYRANQRVRALAVEQPSPRVLDAASYRAVNEWMIERLIATRTVSSGYILSGTALIHRDAVVARDVTFVGPAIVGPGAEIRSRAVIVGPSSIGRDAVVGSGALVSRSAIWRRCVLHDDTVTDRCILADGTTVKPGAKMFRSVMPALASDPVGTPEFADADAVPHNAPSALLRRVRAFVFGTTTISRFPAAQ